MGELWLNGRNYSGGGVEITGEASGAIATFEDGSANPLKSLVVDINPVQAGSGTPSPSNPRAISGWSSVEVTVADDTTDPTTEETYEISLGQTVYGGKLNVATGELTVDRALVELDGSSDENWMMGSSSGHYRAYIKIDDIESYSGAYSSISQLYICSIFDNGSWNNVFDGNPKAGMTGQNWGFGLDSFSITTDTELREWLSTNNIQIAYKLATPTTISLTPTQVSSMLGNNNIWADSGDSDVVYVRDIDKAFNILWDAVMNSNSGTRSLNLMKGAISETKEDIEEPIKEEEETKEGKDEIQR